MTSKLHLLSFSLCLLFLFNVSLARSGRYQEFRQQNQCQLDNLRALEPDNRIESEAGLIESWNPNHDQFQCVGVAIARYHIKTNGLLLPSYTSAPRLVYIERGRGVLGIVFPGCPETFEESQQQQGQRRSNESFSEQDRHQKVRHFREGDILAIPAGVASWTYNDGDSELVSVSLLDTSNYENQLDQNPRRFYIAGNPKDEFKPQQQQHQQQSRRSEQSRRQQQHGSSANNVFSGFETRLLAEALNIDPETARKLQGENDNRGNIVRVERKLDFISPLSSREEQEREERGHEESEHGREQGRQQRQREEREREGRGQEESERGREQRRQQSQEHEREERGQEERGHGREQGRQQSQREERERERRGQEERQCGREQGRQQSPRGQGCQNGVEETFCTMRLTENIGDPSRADVYTPQAGRISTLNSYNLPILGHLRLSAERGVLYNNALYAPHWNLNANSVIFVLRGSARVQVVNDNGDAIFDGELRQGQVLTVPQNHAVLKKASSEGFEWVSFKTNDNAKVSPLAGRTSVIRALPEDVLRNAFQISREQARNLKYNREETTLLSSRSSSERRDERESSSDRRDERDERRDERDERRDERESSSERRDEREERCLIN